MLVGIMSDSHDDMAMIRRAVDEFNARGVAMVLHAGDLISPFTFEEFGSLKCPFLGIFGNNDGDKLLLNEKSGGAIGNQPRTLELDGRKAVMVHEHHSVDALAGSGLYDLVVFGHTHTPDVRRAGRTLVMNPGKTARLHKGISTIAVLDTGKMEAEIIQLEGQGPLPLR